LPLSRPAARLRRGERPFARVDSAGSGSENAAPPCTFHAFIEF